MLTKRFRRVVCDSYRAIETSTKYKFPRKGDALSFCSRRKIDQPEIIGKNMPSADDHRDSGADGQPNGLALDTRMECTETRKVVEQDDSNEDYMKPQSRKERIKSCWAKLQKGPDGRFINVLEVATDMNTLIAAYQNLRARSQPSYLVDNSDDDDDDDKSLKGINIERLKKLQKRLCSGTYRFKPASEVPSSKTKTNKS